MMVQIADGASSKGNDLRYEKWFKWTVVKKQTDDGIIEDERCYKQW